MTHETRAAVERLTAYNSWRRGEGEWSEKTFDDLGLSTNDIGRAIDTIIDALKAADASVPENEHVWVELSEVLNNLFHGWSWARNNRCKYVTLRLDTRSMRCLIYDRDGNPITLSELARQDGK
jgi:hypothetical protein